MVVAKHKKGGSPKWGSGATTERGVFMIMMMEHVNAPSGEGPCSSRVGWLSSRILSCRFAVVVNRP